MKLLRLVLTITALLSFISLAGCNTVSGVGKDLQILGKKMEGSAEPSPRPGSNY